VLFRCNESWSLIGFRIRIQQKVIKNFKCTTFIIADFLSFFVCESCAILHCNALNHIDTYFISLLVVHDDVGFSVSLAAHQAQIVTYLWFIRMLSFSFSGIKLIVIMFF
jgi:hypothetical protein